MKLAAQVHNVGRNRVPAEILNRPGKLGDIDMMLIREDPEACRDNQPEPQTSGWGWLPTGTEGRRHPPRSGDSCSG